MNKSQTLRNAFASAIKPSPKMSIVDWAAKNVKLSRSSRSEYADLKQTPWLIDPLETILGNDATEVVVNAPVGSGKSTMLEIAGTYIVSEKAGPTMFAAQTDPDAQEFFQTGLMPALKNCKLIDNLWPAKQNAIRKDFVQFTHMPLWCVGSNLSNFQSKSLDNVFIDEVWMLKAGLLTEARKRTHDRFGSKVVLVSQSGLLNDDFDLAFKQTYQHEFAYKCRKCNEYHRYEFDNLKWDCEKVEDKVVWESIQTRYECPCGEVYLDNSNDRRSMSESGKYIAGDTENPLNGHVGYHYSALNVWWIEWRKLVVEFLKAVESAKKGNNKFLRQFHQKRLAKPWDEWENNDSELIRVGEYTLSDASQLDLTILTVDVQKQDLWYVVRTWDRDGNSRLLESGKVLSFSEIAKIQEKYSIKANAVFLDSAYRTEEVKNVLAKYKWLGLNGRGDKDYTITNKRTGKKFTRLFDAPKTHQTSNGMAVTTYYSSMGIKDILFILKSGNGARWELPVDVGDEYINQLKSEIKIIAANGHPTYKKIKEQNHLLDCEAEQVVAAMMHRILPSIEEDVN
jgi:hypothetical protein